jgi:hypothetical protein
MHKHFTTTVVQTSFLFIILIVDKNPKQKFYSKKISSKKFLKLFLDRGYKLSFFLAEDPRLTLQEFGEYLYDHLILFSPTVEGDKNTLHIPHSTFHIPHMLLKYSMQFTHFSFFFSLSLPTISFFFTHILILCRVWWSYRRFVDFGFH